MLQYAHEGAFYLPSGKTAVSLFTREAGWKEEALDLVRGLASGTIVGLPLLYTMEVWFHGQSFSGQHLLYVLGAIVLFNFLFALFAGLRSENDGFNFFRAVDDAVTAVALGLVVSVAVLFLIGELRADNGLSNALGKIIIEACAVSVGVCFTNLKFKAGEDNLGEEDEGAGKKPADPEAEQFRIDLKELAATAGGALVFAMSIAPTEEVLMIGQHLSGARLLLLFGFEILIAYVILFAAGFNHRKNAVDSVFQSTWAETLMAVAVSLCVGAVLLLFTGEAGTAASDSTFLVSVIVLGLPAVVGGAAGRLIL